MKWKICGMRDAENIAQIALLEPDYMGFIFWKHSARFVENRTPTLPANIKKTGVFVNALKENIASVIATHQLQAVQLHGEESPEYCEEIQALGVEVIKAFSVKDRFDFRSLTAYETVCDFFLFDTKGKLPGGNGYTFDWSLLRDYTSQKPFFLSGGIGSEEVTELKKIFKMNLPLYGIDLNSKFENKPAIKNTDLLRTFIKEILN